eukprot:5977353-Prymnesium_polylepis.1
MPSVAAATACASARASCAERRSAAEDRPLTASATRCSRFCCSTAVRIISSPVSRCAPARRGLRRCRCRA